MHNYLYIGDYDFPTNNNQYINDHISNNSLMLSMNFWPENSNCSFLLKIWMYAYKLHDRVFLFQPTVQKINRTITELDVIVSYKYVLNYWSWISQFIIEKIITSDMTLHTVQNIIIFI